jgi:transcriptional regulator GlxA family with amidase domain
MRNECVPDGGTGVVGTMEEQLEEGVPGKPEAVPTSIGFLLLNEYTMISLVSAIDPLRMANQISGKTLYTWALITEDGQPVGASDGIHNIPDAAISDAPYFDALIVVGGVDVTRNTTEAQLQWLRKLDSRGVQLGGICTGAYCLAEARLMDGRECSVHWECMAMLHELHPEVVCNNHLFTVERERVTSSGGTAPLDMMLNVISRRHGISLANAISEMFILDRIRDPNDRQKIPLKYTMGLAPPKLVEATTLMEANIEETILLEELAGLLSISRRQLERLFKSNLDCSPSRYYMRLRLDRARQLLKQTSLSIIEVASLCGFVSTPHFSKCYRTYLGITPREERAGLGARVGQNAGADKLVQAIAEPRYTNVRAI